MSKVSPFWMAVDPATPVRVSVQLPAPWLAALAKMVGADWAMRLAAGADTTTALVAKDVPLLVKLKKLAVPGPKTADTLSRPAAAAVVVTMMLFKVMVWALAR